LRTFKLALIFLISLGPSILGCGGGYRVETVDMLSPQRAAAILIGDPQVFSRASLINDRRREVAYLQQLLENSNVDSSGSSKVKFSPQIIRDLRTVQALSLSLGLTAGKSIKDTSSAADLSTQIDVAKLQAQLALLQKQIEGIQAAQAPTVTIPALDLTAAAGPSSSAAQTKIPDVTALATAIKSIQSELTSLKTVDSASAPSNTYGDLADPRDDFSDRQAYRRDIRAAIAEAQLDDVHDRAGNALYRLQFQATVLPPDDAARQWGAAKLSISAPLLTGGEVDSAYYEWLRYLSKQLQDPSSLQSDDARDTSFDGYIGELSQLGFFRLIDVFQSSADASSLTCLRHSTANDLDQLRALIVRALPRNEGANPRYLDYANQSQGFTSAFKPVGTFAVPPDSMGRLSCSAYPSKGQVYSSPLAQANEAAIREVLALVATSELQIATGVEPHLGPETLAQRRHDVPLKFCQAVVDLSGDPSWCTTFQGLPPMSHPVPASAGGARSAAVRAYSVLPTELAQRLGVTTQATQSLQSALSIAALVTPAITGSAGAGILSQSDARAQALARQPLVVGFSGSALSLSQADPSPSSPSSEGSRFFGWLFGPAFSIVDSKTLGLKQAVRSYGVTADVSFPGWWRHVGVNVQTAWVKDWSAIAAATPLGAGDRADTSKTINLPVSDATYESLTNFVAGGDFGPQATKIFARSVTPNLVPACAGSVTFQISGTNIWRADAIYLGGTKARSINVLPDMNGVTADFDMTTVYGALVNAGSSLGAVPLTVFAAQGSAKPLTVWILGGRQTANGVTTCDSPLLTSTKFEQVAPVLSISPVEICADAKHVPLVVSGANLPETLEVLSGGAFAQAGSGGSDTFRRVINLTRATAGSLAVGILPISIGPPNGRSAAFSLTVKDCSLKPDPPAKAVLLTQSVKLAKSQAIALQLKVPDSYYAIKIRVRPQKGGNAAWKEAAADRATPGDDGQVVATFDLSTLRAAVGDGLEVEVDIQDRPDADWRVIKADKTIVVAGGS